MLQPYPLHNHASVSIYSICQSPADIKRGRPAGRPLLPDTPVRFYCCLSSARPFMYWLFIASATSSADFLPVIIEMYPSPLTLLIFAISLLATTLARGLLSKIITSVLLIALSASITDAETPLVSVSSKSFLVGTPPLWQTSSEPPGSGATG